VLKRELEADDIVSTVYSVICSIDRCGVKSQNRIVKNSQALLFFKETISMIFTKIREFCLDLWGEKDCLVGFLMPKVYYQKL